MSALANLKTQIAALDARIDALQKAVDEERRQRGIIRKKIFALQSKRKK